MARDITIDTIQSFPHEYHEDLIWASENKVRCDFEHYDQMRDALEYLEGKQFDSFLELGVLWGAGSLLYSRFVRTGGSVIGCDDFSGITIDNNRDKIHARVCRTFDYISNKRSVNARFENVSISEFFKQNNETFDLIHVDADHGFLNFFHDVILAYSALREGGVMILDDVKDYGVPGPGSALGWAMIRDRVSAVPVSNTRHGIIERTPENDQFFFPLKPMLLMLKELNPLQKYNT